MIERKREENAYDDHTATLNGQMGGSMEQMDGLVARS